MVVHDRHHGMVVMCTLDEIIAALDDDDDNVADMIVEQGRSQKRDRRPGTISRPLQRRLRRTNVLGR